MEPVLTSAQAFEAMRRFLAAFNEREPVARRETIDQLLRWTASEPDGGTFDLAQLDDWGRAVRSVVATDPGVPPVRVSFDPDSDAAYIHLTGHQLMPGRDSVAVETPHDAPHVVVMDWKDERLTGVEILAARRLLHHDLLDHAYRSGPPY